MAETRLGYGLLYGKGKRVDREEMTVAERDKAFKKAFVLIYYGYRASIGDLIEEPIEEFMRRHALHHIKRKKPHPELRHVFSNCMLVSPDIHENIHRGLLPHDYDNREPGFLEILKACEF